MGRDELCMYGRTVVRERLSALFSEADGVRRGEDIEFVHRMRVASRRLRSALRIFQECFKGRKGKRWREAAKEVTSSLGQARDLDVQIEFLTKMGRKWEGEEAVGLALIVNVLRCRRAALQPDIAALMDALQGKGPLLELCRELEGCAEWSGQASALRPSAYAHAAVAVDELMSHADSVPVYEDWRGHHALRIAGKHLRYALEAFREVYEGRLEEEIYRLKGLQDVVGELHDCDVWLQRIPEMRSEVPEASAAFDRLQLEFGEERRNLHGQLMESWGELEQDRFFQRLLTRLKGVSDAEVCPMKVALISDVHGNPAALKAVLAHAREIGVAAILNAGDTMGLPRPEEAAALLMGSETMSVLGNIDMATLERRDGRGRGDAQVDMAAERMGEGGWEWLAYLPEEVRLDICGRTVYMTHAAPGEVTEKLLPGTPDVRYQELAAEVNADLVVVGHTHIPMVKKVSGTLFVNPGSVGRPRDGPEASYAVVDFPSLDVRAYRVAYDSAAAAEEVAAMGMEDLASALAEGRNSDSQGAVGRWASGLSPDWAHVEQVRTLAMLLFDHTRGLHRLGGRERELLELAALAHDVGLSQGAEGHQRRALDLIMGADLPLDRKAKMMVACVARYHGCRPPRDGDRVFKDLRKREREVVRRLASLLALADALDRGHGSAVSGLKVKAGKKELRLKLLGRGPFALEREWGGYKAVQFERTFGRRVRFDD